MPILSGTSTTPTGIIDVSTEYGGGLLYDSNGDICIAGEFAAARQNLQRFLLTNPAYVLPNGLETIADDAFDPDFGIGLKKFLGQFAQKQVLNGMETKAVQAALQAPNVVANPAPIVNFSVVNSFTLEVVLDVWSGNDWGTIGAVIA